MNDSDETGQMSSSEPTIAGGTVAFGADGLVPVVVQDETSYEVLMLAYADREALDLTLESGRAHYFSRSRREIWRKGDTSGHHQFVSSVALDCDGDALIYRVRQVGVACHTGARSCFYRTAPVAPGEASEASAPDGERQLAIGRGMALLERVVTSRLRDLPEGSYVTGLHERGLGYIAQKVVEEAGETVVAALERRDEELRGEAADLLFHLVVLLVASGQSLAAVTALLEERHRERDSA